MNGPIYYIRESFRIFFEKKNLIYFVTVMLPAFAIQVSSAGLTLIFKNIDNQIVFYTLMAVIFILGFVIQVLPYESVFRVVGGENLTFKESLTASVKKLWPFFIVTFLYYLISVLGLVLLIIPGIIFLVWFGFVQYIVVSGGVQGTKAFSESKKLVKGRFFKVFGRGLVFTIFILLLQSLVSVVPFAGVYLTSFLAPLFILPSYLLYLDLKTSLSTSPTV